MFRRRSIALLTAAFTALTVTACGGSGERVGAPATTVAEASTAGLGEVLVDSRGRTLYLFRNDLGTTSTCAALCARDWPPVTTMGQPTVGAGLSESDVGTTGRADGTTQVTYNGHPLYRFQGDHAPGDANGQGLNAFGAAWYVVSPTGHQVTASGSSDNGYAGGAR